MAGDAATLPDGFSLPEGQTIIVAEVFYDYTPWILGSVTETEQIYHQSLYRPRYGGLTTLAP